MTVDDKDNVPISIEEGAGVDIEMLLRRHCSAFEVNVMQLCTFRDSRSAGSSFPTRTGHYEAIHNHAESSSRWLLRAMQRVGSVDKFKLLVAPETRYGFPLKLGNSEGEYTAGGVVACTLPFEENKAITLQPDDTLFVCGSWSLENHGRFQKDSTAAFRFDSPEKAKQVLNLFKADNPQTRSTQTAEHNARILVPLLGGVIGQDYLQTIRPYLIKGILVTKI